MVFGLGTKKKEEPVKEDVASAKKVTGSQADEAAEILKKMEAKKDSGDCAFC